MGYEANAAVVAYLLENKLGYTVEKKTLNEEISWQGFETGEVDVILENWGHPDLEKTYIDDKKVAVVAGETGNVGIIGWYVPEWMVQEHPDITDWNNLNKYADLFKTSESGDKGQFLAGDPTFVHERRGAHRQPRPELQGRLLAAARRRSIKAFQQAAAQKTPLIGYFYDPQWLHAQIKLVPIKLPPYSDELRRGPEEDRLRLPASTPSTRSSARSSPTPAARPTSWSRTSPGRTTTRTSSRTTSPTRT